MKKYLQYFIFFISISNLTFAQTGWIENGKDYENILKKNLQATFGTKLPAQIDLSKYAPSVINQDDSGVCVGMSTAYYMRTILEAISKNITDKDEIDKITIYTLVFFLIVLFFSKSHKSPVRGLPVK